MTEAERRLMEWAQWAHNWMPDLGYGVWPLAELMWHREGDPGYGEEAPPESPVVDLTAAQQEQAAQTDRLITTLPIVHVLTIKRHYINRRRVTWEDLGAAHRAFGDILNA